MAREWRSAAAPQPNKKLTTEDTETTERNAFVLLCELCGVCGASFLRATTRSHELVVQRRSAATKQKAHHGGHREHREKCFCSPL
jgi:hypothetical protein